MWPFRSKVEKKIDALQDVLNARLLAVDAALKLFTLATDEFDRLEQSPDTETWKMFKAAQARHQYFTNALLSDLGNVEDRIKRLRLASAIAVRSDPLQVAASLHEVERLLADTEENVGRLGNICREMTHATGLTAT